MIPVDSFYQKLNSVRAVVVKRKDDLCHGISWETLRHIHVTSSCALQQKRCHFGNTCFLRTGSIMAQWWWTEFLYRPLGAPGVGPLLLVPTLLACPVILETVSVTTE